MIHTKQGDVVEFYHRAVVASLIGHNLAVPLDLEPVQPGEGEVVAAKRLLARLLEPYGRSFDAVVGDGLYFEAPFFNFCLEHGKHALAVIKDENRDLFADAAGLFRTRPPKVWRDGPTRIEAWDEEGFGSMTGVKASLRVLHTEEHRVKRERFKGKWRKKQEQHTWWWAATIPKKLLGSRGLWRAGHGRWGIENHIFNQLSTHWALDHCFKHHPQAILNFVLILFMAFTLLQCFYQRDLKPALRRLFTLIGLVAQLYLGLAEPRWTAPWLAASPSRPP